MIFFCDNLQSISVGNSTKVSINCPDNKLSLHNSWSQYQLSVYAELFACNICNVHANPPRVNVVTYRFDITGEVNGQPLEIM